MNIQKLINEYTSWLKSEITFERYGEYYEITTPYLDNANDYLQIYVKQENDNIFFTDDSATINGLKMSGFQLTKNRKEYIEKILYQYGVTLNGTELTAKAPANFFAQKKHMFIQAMLRVDDLFATIKTRVQSSFLDDILNFFEQKEIYYSDNVQFTGTSGFTHTYDFLLQRSKNQPERLCQAVNNPTKNYMESILFSWHDTKPARKHESQLIVILNDQNNIAKGVEDGFINYDAKVIHWSERSKKQTLELLVAS